MDKKGLQTVLRDVFGAIRTEEINGWLSIRCPLATWLHEKGADNRSSAGVSIQPNKTSIFNCYACKTKVPLHGLIERYGQYTGEDFSELVEELEEEAYLGPKQMLSWDEARRREESAPPAPMDKETILDLYDSAAGHPYIEGRGIDADTANKLQLMVDPADPADGCERILFPVFGPDGELYGLSGRDTTGEAALKVRDYEGLKKAHNVLGIHLIDPAIHTHINVVEGLVDYANGWAQGEPTVAVMHSTMTEVQAQLILEKGLPVYLFYDNDEAGMKGADIAASLLYEHVPTHYVTYPEIWIEDDQQEDGGHWLKDPAELFADDFKSMREDAELA